MGLTITDDEMEKGFHIGPFPVDNFAQLRTVEILKLDSNSVPT